MRNVAWGCLDAGCSEAEAAGSAHDQAGEGVDPNKISEEGNPQTTLAEVNLAFAGSGFDMQDAIGTQTMQLAEQIDEIAGAQLAFKT